MWSYACQDNLNFGLNFFNEIKKTAHFAWAFLCLRFPQNLPKSVPLLRKSVAMLRIIGSSNRMRPVDF